MNGISKTTRMMRSQAVLLVAVVTAACGGSGKVCKEAKDCEDGLICDIHDGKGTCQEPHGHESASAGESQGSSAGDASTGPGSSTGAPTSGAPTSGDTGAATSTGDPANCVEYCACLMTTCGEHDGFPYADAAACEAACGDFSGDTFACWSHFCQLATTASGDTLHHHCEHASGAAGAEECE